MKVLERIVDGLIRQLVSVNDSQFGFVPGRGTTDAICIVRQLQEKYLATNKRLYMAFVDLETAVDQEPWKVFWWALRKFDVEEWIVRLVKGMYANVRPCWWVVQWRVWSEGCSLRLGTQPAALHHCAWSIIMPVLLWGSLGGPLYQWPCCHRWIAWGMCQESLDLERSNGGERTESKCRKDEDHDLWYRPGSPAELASFHVTSVALEWATTASSAMAASTGCTRNAVGSSTWQRILITDVHSARELHAPWMADHRGKSKSDLTSWRW